MTRRQQIANAIFAIGLMVLFGWLCSVIFALLGTQTDWSKAWEYRETLWRGWLVTLKISFAALGGSIFFGLLFMLGQRSPLVVVRWTCRAFLEFVRDTPLLVHLLFGYFVIFAPLVSRPLGEQGFDDKLIIGVLLLSVFEGAYLGEILRGGKHPEDSVGIGTGGRLQPAASLSLCDISAGLAAGAASHGGAVCFTHQGLITPQRHRRGRVFL
jgi:polar amino acid transport system permease protein